MSFLMEELQCASHQQKLEVGNIYSSFIKSVTIVSTLKPQNNKEVRIQQVSYWEKKPVRMENFEYFLQQLNRK